MANRQSNHTGLFPIVERPAWIRPRLDSRLLRIADRAGQALARCVPPAWTAPYSPIDATGRLMWWCQEVNKLITDSSAYGAYVEVFAGLEEDQMVRVDRWLRGDWSEDREALELLLWHLELGAPTVSAALWLHQVSAGPPGGSDEGEVA